MNWLRKLSGTKRSHSGLEWWLWQRLPAIVLIATLLPLSIPALMHMLYEGASSDQPRQEMESSAEAKSRRTVHTDQN
jgi:succinate dehydrogenase hydrophobic anchor subunit